MGKMVDDYKVLFPVNQEILLVFGIARTFTLGFTLLLYNGRMISKVVSHD